MGRIEIGKLVSEERVREQTGTYSDTFLTDVIAGLRSTLKWLPSIYFYDTRGSQLFDQICELPEYYPTRTEIAILRQHVPHIAQLLGPNCVLIEYGSGSSTKTRSLLDHLPDLAAYVPIDVSSDYLLRAANDLVREYPGLTIVPLATNFAAPYTLPPIPPPTGRYVIYFPGSTIGNFTPEEALPLLRQIASVAGRNGGLVVGVDLKKSPALLEAAYNDSQGVTAAFNLNMLERINRELGANFNLERFAHRSFYNEREGRIEMHLVSREDQTVRIANDEFCFDAGETIRTEYSYKYGLGEFKRLTTAAGFRTEHVWTDDHQLFSVILLQVD